METRVTFYLKLPFTVKQKRKWHVAGCPALDVFSQGASREEAEANLKEAVSLFLASCFERGTLDQVLKDCGFRPDFSTGGVQEDKALGFIEVPIPFTVSMEPVACLA